MSAQEPIMLLRRQVVGLEVCCAKSAASMNQFLVCFISYASVVAVKITLHPPSQVVYFDRMGRSLGGLHVNCSLGDTQAQKVYAMEVSRVTSYPPKFQVLASASVLNDLSHARVNTEVLQGRNASATGGINSYRPTDSAIELTLGAMTCTDSGKYVCVIYFSNSNDPDGTPKIVYKYDSTNVYVGEHPSVAVARALTKPTTTLRVYQPGEVINITCRAFVGSTPVTWVWEERIIYPTPANSSFQPMKVLRVSNALLLKSKNKCRTLGSSVISYTVPNATEETRQMRCKATTNESSFEKLAGTFTYFIGTKPTNATVPDIELYPPRLDGVYTNASSLQAYQSQAGRGREVIGYDSLWYLLGFVAATTLFIVVLFLTLWGVSRWKQRSNYISRHAIVYHQRGVDRGWGPGHEYIVE
ncbi:uncharacterized protein LOC112569153 isoform X2 [Pomacea canaliculata]|uniref:uncharacterized protein LOC112569153 isoform X2 n=1 Tax=Pomacea canaliculata TaxID=400727 RepID=UPI000D738743|nr:uncharacterized protein LOC112569153 isoform X2 [Pomacea canaliculata]